MAKKPQTSDSNINLVEVAVGVAVILLIVGVTLWSKWGAVITWLTIHLRFWMLTPFTYASERAHLLQNFLTTVDPTSTTFGQYMIVAAESGQYVRWIYVPILLCVAAYLLLKAPLRKFNKRHNMESLARDQMHLWPEVAPSLLTDLTKGDLTKGPWAVTQTEWEFARLHQLTSNHRKEGPTQEFAFDYDDERARAVFAMQLGAMWRGFDALPKHTQGVVAVLAHYITAIDEKGDKKEVIRSEALKRIRAMNMDFYNRKGDVTKMDFSWARAMFKQAEQNRYVREALRRHAYVFTVIATLLQLSRVEGVVSSNLFVWLRPVDRRLYYTLNAVGRYAFFAEVAGVMAHWNAEKKAKHKLLIPQTRKTAEALYRELTKYTVESELDKLFG